MKNISPLLLNEATDGLIMEMLKFVLPVFEGRGIDYFIVGAFARDLGLRAKGFKQEPSRKTNDIDLAVMVGSLSDYEELMQELAKLPDFKPDEEKPYRILFKNAYDIDLLPFGAIADADGQVTLMAKKTFVLDIPGFQEVEPWVMTVHTQDGLALRVSSLAGVVLLKLLAWEDRPSREKDITDIDYILKNYYLLYVEEIVQSDADLLEFYRQEFYHNEAVSAHFIGREIKRMLSSSPELHQRITNLLQHQRKSSNMARLMKYPTIEDGQRIIEYMHLGLLGS